MTPSAKITFWPNGHVSARDTDGTVIDDLQDKGWLQLFFEHLERMGIDPTTIQFDALVNGEWRFIKPYKVDNEWNFIFDKHA